MGFNLIYWTPMGGFYILIGSVLEKCGKLSGWIWPDWGNAARADLAGLGSIGIYLREYRPVACGMYSYKYFRSSCMRAVETLANAVA